MNGRHTFLFICRFYFARLVSVMSWAVHLILHYGLGSTLPSAIDVSLLL